MAIILQPTAEAGSLKHYQDTIEKRIPISIIQEYVDPELFAEIADHYKSNKTAVWGVTNGSADINKHKWERIKIGDVALFYSNRKFRATSIVAFKLHSNELATKLWGINKKDETWEFMYLLDEVKFIDIDVQSFNKVVGYEQNYIVQGFNVLDENKSQKVLDAFDLYSEVLPLSVQEEEYKSLAAISDPNGITSSTYRKEQSYLRSRLYGNRSTATCGICGREFSTHFLVAAHIKKRSLCTLEEKLDWKNIVMPMCKFGCDELFEKGYIFVENGTIQVNLRDTDSVNRFLNILNGKPCSYWNSESEKYFKFHKEYHLSK